MQRKNNIVVMSDPDKKKATTVAQTLSRCLSSFNKIITDCHFNKCSDIAYI